MDPLATFVTSLAGPGLGAAIVGLVWALAKSVRRRGEGAAVRDEASARAVDELIVQIGAVRRDLERETAARVELQGEVEQLRDQVAEAQSARAHFESQVHIMGKELDVERRARVAAEGRERSLADELAELRRAILGGHTLPSNIPPARG